MDPVAYTDRALARLRAVNADLGEHGNLEKLRRVALASDFAIETLVRQPELLAALIADDGASATPAPQLTVENRSEWPALLRRCRTAESTRLIWRDVCGFDDVDATLAGSTQLAETCLRVALAAVEAEFAQRFGTVRDSDGNAQQLVVFGLGKLGGGELNFSSDIDLVYAYPQDGESDGARALAAEDYFARLGQQLAKLLDEVTADGFSHRVDLRLRPFGNAGRVALPFAAMESYFQRDGRDWERYAWQKARPVAGDVAAGERFLETLRPFVYRRYLDYGALDGLREMKAAIAAEVARKELADDIKRGPGGIREIEFLVQALQLIRGGREPTLRERRLLPALQALVAAGHIAADTGDALALAYRFLRRLENRLQMLRDAQTHALPEEARDRTRIAHGLGYPDWGRLRVALDVQRERVAAEFAALLAPRRRARETSELAAYWRALPDAGDVDVLNAAGFDDSDNLDGSLRDFARAPGVRDLSDAARARLDRVLPALLEAAARSSQPDAALRRLLPLLHTLLRRASYLALLDEQPAALARLVDVVSRSALLAERLAAHPLLLDELLDLRIAGPLPDRAALAGECVQVLLEDDAEAALMALNEKRQALSFRIAVATLDARQPAQDSARQLAWLADAVIHVVLHLAQRELRAAHGVLADARFAVLGYGSLGGEELGFGSDLDLVFLYDAPIEAHSDGARPLEASRWIARLAQKIVALLGTVTGAGRLYEVDVRLRPDGAKGLLVSTLASFADYQRERAWTWEHQALVRARGIAGDATLLAEFENVRGGTLARARDDDALRNDIVAMRRKMRAELDRSDAARFDLKQGEGGLVDLEFLLQYLVLRNADAHPHLLAPRDTPGLLRAACDATLFNTGTCEQLTAAHAVLLDSGLRCTLDRRSRITAETEAIGTARAAIRSATQTCGLDFESAS
ncbi:bifunctional [glutamate--ammonia ligase]-adenylyl-L-tyrosine phosphorylase/[glutamate--ammonia-ligase] adenylyltransferase [Lysobacter sp. CFH 32150]|uniref:bifunctional [glutamate--ammonia ligase]-adenylyl-L-tyrosine phosphorylase/[glutamate--ammonia-ligase] adenylyltransferase n=1 Tax=Lysobacter sp. CFH 32150 TaxID=2927128 RepID=UPI001FA72A77|nr:bifunctional [glutamate--ammonia ligase]-adenylyl-L-tyrosine phosphorylase/[glutamate--ammonia-ligase] adenylyltransferase [Lysobacter sp. CFH 32150]MCI4568314.1 bifunctional [glutamate--ammonia ligase]-adenylyl-L-tyrosine phosphorylase/[glutamate--ammonia-ligase] adenylyltransferase [Lysobacter sp. CFH 32150]